MATSPSSRPEEGANLDASLKKNTAFIKKLKEISDKQREALIKELSSLKLGKYIDEGATVYGSEWPWRLTLANIASSQGRFCPGWRIAATAIAEARPKTSADFDTAVQVHPKRACRPLSAGP